VEVRSKEDVAREAAESQGETTTTTQPPDCAETLPPEGQAAQLLMVLTTTPAEAAAPISSGYVGGFGLKGNQSKDVAAQVSAAVAQAPLPSIVASDEEGGTVQRLRATIGQFPSARELAKQTPEQVAQVYGEHAAAMAQLGFTMDFAPVADVGTGSGLGTRTFGNDPAQVASYVTAIIPAITQAGITPVVKHWPGIGSGTTDPHKAPDKVSGIDALRAKDLIPFDAAIAANVPAIMVTHAEVPGLTGAGEPASLSAAAITGELRGRQRFPGLVITDSLGMGALTKIGSQVGLAERTLIAGSDIALLSGADVAQEAHAAVTDAIREGRLPRDQMLASVRRVLANKGVQGQCLDAVARFSSLTRTASSTTTPGTGSGTGQTDTGVNSSSDGAATTGSRTATTGTANGSSGSPNATTPSTTTARTSTTSG